MSASAVLQKTFNLIFSKFQCLPTSIPDNHHSSTASHLFQNFNSLYDSSFSVDEIVPNFSSAFASTRFFLSSPSTSSSITYLQSSPSPPPPPLPRGVAVHIDSHDPYSDFRNSMVEMIESADSSADGDWELPRELLEVYLVLNPKHAHKFIVSAFADVVVSMAG